MIALHHKHLRYGVHEQQHEAGYDAFLTAQVFLSLSAEMSAVEKIPKGGLDLINSGNISQVSLMNRRKEERSDGFW
jgi:DNA polymerase III epsilon subunit-like protein